MHRRFTLTVALMLAAAPAIAHVKWFSKVANCASTPLTPTAVMLSAVFALLYACSTMAIAGTVWAERLLAGMQVIISLTHSLNRYASRLAAPVLRVAVAAYFAVLPFYFYDNPIILTPELKSDAAWVSISQLLVSASIAFRLPRLLAALGILMLYGHAIAIYGWFHMLDYPFFIGIAAFLAIDAIHGPKKHQLGFGVLRVLTAVSFLFVSVEKWMYPQWVYDILARDLGGILMGFSPPFFVMAAGFVEFSLAFLLLAGRLSSQVASLVLLLFMLSAIPLVGMVDAIGHAPLIVVLLIFAAMQNRSGPSLRLPPVSAENFFFRVLVFMAAVPSMVGLYYLAHAIAYRHGLENKENAAILATALSIPVLGMIGVYLSRSGGWRRAAYNRTVDDHIVVAPRT